MSDSNMPVIEAEQDVLKDTQAYELAFHVLPTMTEGEVQSVCDRLKALITNASGSVTLEEVPARFDLAYDLVKFLEGRNRKFSSSYFGWIRFTLSPDAIEEVTKEVAGSKELLRHLIIKLTRTEEAHPFFFHPAIADRVVETIIVEAEDAEVVEEATEEVAEEKAADDGEVKEETV
jgi:ribosomal protein S6